MLNELLATILLCNLIFVYGTFIIHFKRVIIHISDI
jgi:hypothetical protein